MSSGIGKYRPLRKITLEASFNHQIEKLAYQLHSPCYSLEDETSESKHWRIMICIHRILRMNKELRINSPELKEMVLDQLSPVQEA